MPDTPLLLSFYLAAFLVTDSTTIGGSAMDIQLSYGDLFVAIGFLVASFSLSGMAAQWSGMKMEEIERMVHEFKDQHHCHDFSDGYPIPLLMTHLKRYEGAVSRRRGLVFFCGNLVLAGIVFVVVDHWWIALCALTLVLLFERALLVRMAWRQRQSYDRDMDACASYYGVDLRISGSLKWVMTCSADGRIVELRIRIRDSVVLSDGEYSLMVYVPEHLDTRYITYGRRALFNVFKQPVSLFLRVRDAKMQIYGHVAELELHALYPGVLASNTERDLRVVSSFVHQIPPKKRPPLRV